MVNVGVVGATGYVGIELLRLYHLHPQINLTYISSVSQTGEKISNIYPHMSNIYDLTTENVPMKDLKDRCDVVFLAGHVEQTVEYIKQLQDEKIRTIDTSAAARIKNSAEFKKFYKEPPLSEKILKTAIYGLPEVVKRSLINSANLIANPGCYPTASILASYPVLKENLIKNQIIIDAKSGIAGAGRSLSQTTHFCEVHGNFTPYQVGGIHRHIPEIKQEFDRISGNAFDVLLTPYLLPCVRGLMATCYFQLKKTVTLQDLHDLYAKTYENDYFVRVLPIGSVPSLKNVVNSNFCDIGLFIDKMTGYLVVVSAIDNLVKGAAGQAIQNMNLMFELPEQMGLMSGPTYL